MFGSLNKTKLITNDLKGMAKLMYLDVSKDTWDQENLTKRNLDFTIESIRYIDVYTKRLMTTEMGKSLLDAHFDTFVIRTGAYIGEVIKREIKKDYKWYEFDSVFQYSSILDGVPRAIKEESVLYSKKNDIAILSLTEAAQCLTAKSSYPDLLSYVEEMIKQNS
ncbi:hypothetical protein [Peribacillus sp. NPDC097895]|uniref:hypothetical protein n=1 Tax=Peribacillus sp. NPDC097895 TaxID=3390619 RepID=UPI003D025421